METVREAIMELKLTDRQKETLERATALYESNVSEIEDYLAARGIDAKTAKAARLGYVREPIAGHEAYKGRLAIPYLTPTGVVDIRFRCVQKHNCNDAEHPKYLTQPGHATRLYNTIATLAKSDTIAICEGELDAVILTHRVGIPAVALPGADTWKNRSYYPRIFADYTNVFVFPDNDEAGRKLATDIVKSLDDVTVVILKPGYDVTDTFLEEGTEGLLQRAGL